MRGNMRRWYFWVLAPIMLATGVGLPFLVNPPNVQGYIVLYVMSGALILATIGIASPKRFKPALKVVAATVLIAFIGQAGFEVFAWARGKPFFGDAPGGTSLYVALQGLAALGVPSLYFIVWGRSGSVVDFMVVPEEKERV
jgi:hypothetical protein